FRVSTETGERKVRAPFVGGLMVMLPPPPQGLGAVGREALVGSRPRNNENRRHAGTGERVVIRIGCGGRGRGAPPAIRRHILRQASERLAPIRPGDTPAPRTCRGGSSIQVDDAAD